MPLPPYYDQVKGGNVFIGQSINPTTGVAIPISTTTSPTFGLWNPTGSGVDAVLIKFTAGLVSTNGTPGTILYSVVTNAGSGIATGGPISAFAQVTPTNAYVNGGLASNTRFCGGGTTTLTTAGTVFASSGYTQLTTSTTASSPMYRVDDSIGGQIIVPPGNFVYVTASVALSTLFDMSLWWEEIAK